MGTVATALPTPQLASDELDAEGFIRIASAFWNGMEGLRLLLKLGDPLYLECRCPGLAGLRWWSSRWQFHVFGCGFLGL
jgi:hypothetical protein